MTSNTQHTLVCTHTIARRDQHERICDWMPAANTNLGVKVREDVWACEGVCGRVVLRRRHKQGHTMEWKGGTYKGGVGVGGGGDDEYSVRAMTCQCSVERELVDTL